MRFLKSSRTQRRRSPPQRPASYYRVDGLDLREEMLRLCGLPVFGGTGGELARRPPQLTVRRASHRPRSSLGFAIPDENRISVTAYPGARPGDLLEVLLHELAHIAVGRQGGAWHGRLFKRTLAVAMREGFGVTGVRARGSIHGAYAEAIEQRRRQAQRRRAAVSSDQLAIDTAA